MSGSSRNSKNRNSKNRSTYSGNHQRSWLWGHHAVCETLTSKRWPVLQILVTESALERSRDLLTKARDSGIPLEVVTAARIEELAQVKEHQGLLARLGPYSYTSFNQFIAELKTQVQDYHQSKSSTGGSQSLGSCPLVVICDRIQDNHNFGAILRSCDGASVSAVIVGTSHQTAITPHVVRSSSGAANHVNVVQAENLSDCILKLKEVGFQVLAADASGEKTLWQTDLAGLNAVVLGSEAFGIAPELLSKCDQRVTIPMAGAVSSLNVAVAAGVLLYEVRRQQACRGSW
jgi:23S rRNA (guanosine2251-2'-O)-methyltransferase